MSYIRFFLGAVKWHFRAGFWYIGLGMRLFFAIGLDSNYDHGTDNDPARHFKCPIPRDYRKHLQQKHETS